MAHNMVSQYCKGAKGGSELKFTDGSTVIMCDKAKSVFYATMRKNHWDETKPRPRVSSETVDWYLKQKGIVRKK